MPKYAFHVPVNEYDEFIVEADSLGIAENILSNALSGGGFSPLPGIVAHTELIGGDPRYFDDDVFDCSVFDEDGDQLR